MSISAREPNPELSHTELFKVLEVLQPDEANHMPMVVAGTLASRGVLRWFKDTPKNRRKEVNPALDEGKRVETVALKDGRQLLLITDVEAVPEGNKVMIDGNKPVIGVDGEAVPAAELLIPGDIVELHNEGDEVRLSLIDLADAS